MLRSGLLNARSGFSLANIGTKMARRTVNRHGALGPASRPRNSMVPVLAVVPFAAVGRGLLQWGHHRAADDCSLTDKSSTRFASLSMPAWLSARTTKQHGFRRYRRAPL